MSDFDFRKFGGGKLPETDPVAVEEQLVAAMDSISPAETMRANAAVDFYLRSIMATCEANGLGLGGVTNLLQRKVAMLYEQEGKRDQYLEELRFSISLIERGEL